MNLLEKTSTFGLIVATRGFFNVQLAVEARKKLLAKLDKLGYAYVIPAEEATPNGAIETYKDAKLCAGLFKQHQDEIDGILAVLPNFGDEQGVVQAIDMAKLGVPVIASDLPAFREAGGPIPTFLDPAAPDAWLRAIGELPKTPFSAVGFNVLFALTSTAEEIPAFRFDGYLDSTLRAADREVTMRSAQRKYRWGDGQVLVVVEESVEQPLKLAINLERQSRNEEELKTWLQMPIAEIVAEVNRIQGWF